MVRRARRTGAVGNPQGDVSIQTHQVRNRIVLLLLAVALAGACFVWLRPEAAPSSAGAVDGTEHSPLQLPLEHVELPVEELRADAEETVAILIERFPDSPGSYQTAAMLYQALKRNERAAGYWETCIKLDPDREMPRLLLAQLQMRHGHDEEAAHTLMEAKALGFGSADIDHSLAIALQRAGRLEDAEQVAAEGVASHPDLGDMWLVLGQTQLQLGKLDDARRSFESALNAETPARQAHVSLATLYVQLDDHEKADEHRRAVEYQEAMRLSDTRSFEQKYSDTLRVIVASVLVAAAVEYDGHGAAVEAERLCRRALELDPASVDACRQLASLYHRQERLDDAWVVQHRLAQLEPDNVVNYLNLASLASRLQKWHQAEAALVQAAHHQPRDPRIYEALAAVYAQTGRMSESREAARRAESLQPTRRSPQ